MEPKDERNSDINQGSSAPNEDSEDASQQQLPSTPNFPPPPEISYTRPVLKKGVYAENPDLHPGVSEEQNTINTTARLGAGMSAGITFASSVIVSVLIGMWLDKRFEPGGTPWATIVLAIMGFAAGFITFVRISEAANKNNRRH